MTMQRRADGSMYDTCQLRHKGKFVRKRITMTAFDVLELHKSGFSREESQRALDALNVQIDERVCAGESEPELMRLMRQVFDTSKGKFIDADATV